MNILFLSASHHPFIKHWVAWQIKSSLILNKWETNCQKYTAVIPSFFEVYI